MPRVPYTHHRLELSRLRRRGLGAVVAAVMWTLALMHGRVMWAFHHHRHPPSTSPEVAEGLPLFACRSWT